MSPLLAFDPVPVSAPTAPKPFCRSMEDLNSNSAFGGGGLGPGVGGARFPTLPLPGSPYPGSSPSGHLLVPPGNGGPITRSRSSSNLPENPYDQPGVAGGGARGGATHRAAGPSKSYSHWDMGVTPHRHSSVQVRPPSSTPPPNAGVRARPARCVPV